MAYNQVHKSEIDKPFGAPEKMHVVHTLCNIKEKQPNISNISYPKPNRFATTMCGIVRSYAEHTGVVCAYQISLSPSQGDKVQQVSQI